MRIRWTSRASVDVVRLHAFLARLDTDAAARVVQQLSHAPSRLTSFPRIGEKIEAYEPREVRSINVGHYEMRYEIEDGMIVILRIWHHRENRSAGDEA